MNKRFIIFCISIVLAASVRGEDRPVENLRPVGDLNPLLNAIGGFSSTINSVGTGTGTSLESVPTVGVSVPAMRMFVTSGGELQTWVLTSGTTANDATHQRPSDYNASTNARVWTKMGGSVSFASVMGKPTTLTGYGITDAQPLDSDLTAIAALSTTAYGRAMLALADQAALRLYVDANNASKLTTGTVPDARLSANVPLLDGSQNLILPHNLSANDGSAAFLSLDTSSLQVHGPMYADGGSVSTNGGGDLQVNGSASFAGFTVGVSSDGVLYVGDTIQLGQDGTVSATQFVGNASGLTGTANDLSVAFATEAYNADYAGVAADADNASSADYAGNSFDDFFHTHNLNTDTSFPGDGSASFASGTVLIGADSSLTLGEGTLPAGAASLAAYQMHATGTISTETGFVGDGTNLTYYGGSLYSVVASAVNDGLTASFGLMEVGSTATFDGDATFYRNASFSGQTDLNAATVSGSFRIYSGLIDGAGNQLIDTASNFYIPESGSLSVYSPSVSFIKGFTAWGTDYTLSSQPPAPTDLAGVISLLEVYGLCN